MIAMSYLHVVQMDIPAEHEAEFNRIYDQEHMPTILHVPDRLSRRQHRPERVGAAGARGLSHPRRPFGIGAELLTP